MLFPIFSLFFSYLYLSSLSLYCLCFLFVFLVLQVKGCNTQGLACNLFKPISSPCFIAIPIITLVNSIMYEILFFLTIFFSLSLVLNSRPNSDSCVAHLFGGLENLLLHLSMNNSSINFINEIVLPFC